MRRRAIGLSTEWINGPVMLGFGCCVHVAYYVFLYASGGAEVQPQPQPQPQPVADPPKRGGLKRIFWNSESPADGTLLLFLVSYIYFMLY